MVGRGLAALAHIPAHPSPRPARMCHSRSTPAARWPRWSRQSGRRAASRSERPGERCPQGQGSAGCPCRCAAGQARRGRTRTPRQAIAPRRATWRPLHSPARARTTYACLVFPFAAAFDIVRVDPSAGREASDRSATIAGDRLAMDGYTSSERSRRVVNFTNASSCWRVRYPLCRRHCKQVLRRHAAWRVNLHSARQWRQRVVLRSSDAARARRARRARPQGLARLVPVIVMQIRPRRARQPRQRAPAPMRKTHRWHSYFGSRGRRRFPTARR